MLDAPCRASIRVSRGDIDQPRERPTAPSVNLVGPLMVAAVLRLAERADAWTDGLQGYLLSQQGGSEFGRFFDRLGRDTARVRLTLSFKILWSRSYASRLSGVIKTAYASLMSAAPH